MQPTVPAVRRRPKDRKKQILDQAARLFIDRGFHSVKLEEIAEAAGVTARALYRHYDNKQALLTAVILNAQDEYQSVRNPEGRTPTSTARPPLHDELPDLIAAAVETRALTVLWQREARYLTDHDRTEVRGRINAIVASMQSGGVRLEMPELSPPHVELRAWAVSSTLTSLGRHTLTLPGAELRELLYRACMAAARTPAVGALEPIEGTGAREAASFSRYETLLAAGAQLFRARGYPAVSTADIGKTVGIAGGPGLYRSFSSKQAILDAWCGGSTSGRPWSPSACSARMSLHRSVFTISSPGGYESASTILTWSRCRSPNCPRLRTRFATASPRTRPTATACG